MSRRGRRPAQRAPYCEHCGVTTPNREIVVVDPLREDVPDIRALTLCASCRESPLRTWRLRWRPAADRAAIA
jgi:hypothetical protein